MQGIRDDKVVAYLDPEVSYCIEDIDSIEMLGIDGGNSIQTIQIELVACGEDTVLPEG